MTLTTQRTNKCQAISTTDGREFNRCRSAWSSNNSTIAPPAARPASIVLETSCHLSTSRCRSARHVLGLPLTPTACNPHSSRPGAGHVECPDQSQVNKQCCGHAPTGSSSCHRPAAAVTCDSNFVDTTTLRILQTVRI